MYNVACEKRSTQIKSQNNRRTQEDSECAGERHRGGGLQEVCIYINKSKSTNTKHFKNLLLISPLPIPSIQTCPGDPFFHPCCRGRFSARRRDGGAGHHRLAKIFVNRSSFVSQNWFKMFKGEPAGNRTHGLGGVQTVLVGTSRIGKRAPPVSGKKVTDPALHIQPGTSVQGTLVGNGSSRPCRRPKKKLLVDPRRKRTGLEVEINLKPPKGSLVLAEVIQLCHSSAGHSQGIKKACLPPSPTRRI